MSLWDDFKAVADDADAALAATRAELTAAQAALEVARTVLNQTAQERDAAELERNLIRAEYDAHMAAEHPAPTNPNLDRVGIQVFPDRRDLSYWDHETTLEMLRYLGVKLVRGGIGPGTTQRTIDFYNRAYDELGVRACLTVGKPRDPLTPAQWDEVATTVGSLRGVHSLASWNEPNHQRSSSHPPLDGWARLTVEHGRELMARFGDQHEILSAQLWSGRRTRHDTDLRALAATIADGTRYGDTFHTIAWHLYQPGPERLAEYEAIYRGLFGDKPIVCTETGMSTAPNQAQGALSMTEAGQAAYLPEHIGMYLNAGHRVFWFELRDEHDPAGTDREDWLGVFRHDGTPKPAADALRELLA